MKTFIDMPSLLSPVRTSTQGRPLLQFTPTPPKFGKRSLVSDDLDVEDEKHVTSPIRELSFTATAQP